MYEAAKERALGQTDLRADKTSGYAAFSFRTLS